MADQRWRGRFNQSPASRLIQRDLGRMKFRAGGPSFVSSEAHVVDVLGERIGAYVNEVLRRWAPRIREAVIKDRMSNKVPMRANRGGYIKLKGKDGVRKRDGNLQGSVRMTVTSPGTNARRFRGTVTLSSKCGGSRAPYAGILEARGLLQFGQYTTAIYGQIIPELRGGITAIAAQFGATVS